MVEQNALRFHDDIAYDDVHNGLVVDNADGDRIARVIGDSGNAASIGVHAAWGFLPAGTLRSIGFKFGRWVDGVYMRRPLGPGDGTRP